MKLAIKLVRSGIGHPKRQKMTLRALGLRRLGSTTLHNDTPEIRGMLRKVRHLVQVEAVQEVASKGEQE